MGSTLIAPRLGAPTGGYAPMIGYVTRRVVAVAGVTGAATVSLDLATIIVALGALGTAIYNVIRVRQAQPTVEADLEDRAVARMRQALDIYTADNERLREAADHLERVETELRLEVRMCKQRIEHLSGVISRAGLDVR